MRYDALIFDLDDTLVDTRLRHYKIVFDFLRQQQCAPLSFSEYITVRKEHSWSNSQLIDQYYPETADQFPSFWREHIESEDYLEYDTEIVSAKLLFEVKTQNQCPLFLVSLRSKTAIAENQFKKFSFSGLFEEPLFLAHNPVNPKITVLKNFHSRYPNMLFFGDTINDVEASAEANVEFRGVSTGIYALPGLPAYHTINHVLLNILE